MNWEKPYLKHSFFWFAILVASILFLYFDKPFWAVLLWLAQISHQLIVLMIAILLKSGKDYNNLD